MPIQLDNVELRVLGVLIEKSLTQPNGYPLTLNAIVAGANQKQNRDPVVSYSEQEVGKALYSLERRRFVAQAPPSPGARANRFCHNVVEELHWDRREQAVMAELILRGRQTAGELRSRAGRMTPLQDAESALNVLNALRAADPPFVEELPREPGRSANRFRHLISLDTEESDRPVSAVQPPSQHREADAERDPFADRLAVLEARVDALERAVADLRGDV